MTLQERFRRYGFDDAADALDAKDARIKELEGALRDAKDALCSMTTFYGMDQNDEPGRVVHKVANAAWDRAREALNALEP